MGAQLEAVTIAPTRSYLHEETDPVNLATETQLNKDTTEMTTATANTTSTIAQAANALPEAAREVQQAAERTASTAARAAHQTLANAGDQLHAAASSIKDAMVKPSFWKKAGKIAAIGAGVAAVGGAAYVAYRYFKDGQAPGVTVEGAMDAAKQVVDKVVGQ